MSGRLQWQSDGADWPHRAQSQFIKADGLTLHCQIAGQGPDILLLHGTGASSHSWRDLFAPLTRHFRIIVPDLPGHAFSDPLPAGRLSLDGMAHAIARLMGEINATPIMIAGHSAGAAIAIQMALKGLANPQAIVSINGALRPFGGIASQIFPPLARLLVLNPFVPSFFAWRAEDPNAVAQLIEGTGSRITEEGLDYYRRLFRSRAHVAATLKMMANWDLDELNRHLPNLRSRLILIAAQNDKAVEPDTARSIKKRLPDTQLILMRDVGHLCHEEEPRDVAAILIDGAK